MSKPSVIGVAASKIIRRLNYTMEMYKWSSLIPQSNHPSRNRITRPSPAAQHGLPHRLFLIRNHISAEEALTTASKTLDCAAATAYGSTEQLDATNRKMMVAVACLLGTVQELVESALDTRHREG